MVLSQLSSLQGASPSSIWFLCKRRGGYDKEKQFDMAEEKKKNVKGNASRMVEEGKRREEAGKQRELQREQQRKQQLEDKTIRNG